MNYKRFREIIQNGRKYEKEVDEAIQEFQKIVNLNGNITKLMKEISERLDLFMIEIPMKDSDFGAVFLDSGYSKYLLLNSNQSRCKMYFSFFHDIYHVLKGSTNYINERREVHFNNDYLMDENECKANLFAAKLLMPEPEFVNMYNLYKYNNPNLEEITLKLMNYFDSPFIAVLIRLFELNLIDSMEEIIELLNIDDKQLKHKLNKIGISDEIIKPTLEDNMEYVFELLNTNGLKLIEEGLLDENRYKSIISRLKKFYEEIKLDDKSL
ncbi:MAG: ImmA/IrrE family metallo-endopeptidase [Intestinibacter sp.]